jgi:hypothetical protein
MQYVYVVHLYKTPLAGPGICTLSHTHTHSRAHTHTPRTCTHTIHRCVVQEVLRVHGGRGMHGVLAAGQGGASAWPGTMAEESDECVGTNSQKNPTNSQKNPTNSQKNSTY